MVKNRAHTPALRARHRLAYRAVGLACRFVQVQCIRLHVLDPTKVPREPCLLAVTHLSHLEPVIVGLVVRPRIRWMSRAEFYRRRPARLALDALGAFSVNRAGVAASAIRTAVEELGRGGTVGVFPEGGVKTGRDAVIRGGTIRRGVCLIAQRSGRPVVPTVVLGTDRLLRPRAYLPFRRSTIWLAFGDPIPPPPPAATGAATTGGSRGARGRDRGHLPRLVHWAAVSVCLERRGFPVG